MAEAILRQLGASRSILQALGGNVAFHKASAAEARKVKQALLSVALQSVELAQVVTAINEVGFAADDLASLLEVIAEAAIGQPAAPALQRSSRSSMQSWETFVNYLPASLWSRLQAGQIDDLLGFLINLGLRHPSESTSASVALVALHQTEGPEKLSEMSPDARLQFVKTIKATFKTKVKYATPPIAFVPCLPKSPRDFALQFPVVYEANFAKEPPAECPISELVLAQLRTGTRMRAVRSSSSLSLALAPQQIPANVTQFGQGIVTHTQHLASEIASIENQQPPTPKLTFLGTSRSSASLSSGVPVGAIADSPPVAPVSEQIAIPPPAPSPVVVTRPVSPVIPDTAGKSAHVAIEELSKALDEKSSTKPKAKAKAKGKGQAKAKGKGKAKAKASPTKLTGKKDKVEGKVKGKGKGEGLVLGCSKCRYSSTGCKQCKDPSFKGKRGSK